ncbi:MAG TPA: PrsW family glutamic-type intramembrane protease [Dehalococcoidia bacterium]|nr:PrsW family glutamic-type intramembrane protease [Dehalococcoidia bacterium]
MQEPGTVASGQPAVGLVPPGLRYHLLAVALALAGGAFGIFGAFVEELRTGGGLLALFVGAPIIEEALKPCGVYSLAIRWPKALRNQLYTACLAALGGLAFGLIECWVYLALYVPDHTEAFTIYRLTAPLVMHTVGSFIVGLGINRSLVDWAAGRGRFPRRSRTLYLAAVALHGAFNLATLALYYAGPLHIN